jgi:Asp-tRNA(Asn)/Glu-tRNA(Gln) amidotransferase A subunit family amidase
MSGNELLELSAGQALERIAAGELSNEEYFDAYAEATAGDDLDAYLWRAEPGSTNGATDGPLRGAPIAVKDIFCGSRAAHPAARRPRWRAGWRRGRSAPTPGARSASRDRCAALSA